MHGHQWHRCPADFHGPKPRETQRMRKANQPDKSQVGFRFLDKAEHNSDRALASRRTFDCSPEQVITARRVGRHEIYNDNVADLFDRLATGRLKEVWAWISRSCAIIALITSIVKHSISLTFGS